MRVSLRLRQVALATRELERSAALLTEVLGLGEPFHDPGVGVFGLCNSVFAIGDTFLELVSPVREDASAGRFLCRKNGDAGYMVIVQSDDLERDRARMDRLGVRVVFETWLEDIATVHLHPRDVGAAIVSIDQAIPPGSWRWAGPGWEQRGSGCADALSTVEIACQDPASTSARWATVLDCDAAGGGDGSFVLALEPGAIRFSRCAKAEEEGVVRVGLVAGPQARESALARAVKLGLPATAEEFLACGTWFRLSA
jgi:catechol 2,3-dioxygenase-like lactoylglutathione lyase family enzyme